MRKAVLFALAAVLLAAGARPAASQPAGQRVRLVGLLVPGSLQTQNEYSAFEDELRKLGYRSGKDLRLLPKEAAGKLERLPALARELADAGVEVIVAFNTPGVQAAIDATSQVPIVMTQVGDPVGSGFVGNLARPGGNVTGVSNLTAGLAPKRVQVLREAIPSARRIAVLFNPADPVTRLQIGDLEGMPASRDIVLRMFPVRALDDLADTFAQMRAWKADAGMWLAGQHQLFQATTIKLAARYRLPVMVGFSSDVRKGGLMAYGSSGSEVFRRTAAQVALILGGRSPGDLPVEQPTRFELAVNLKTAKALGLKIPGALVVRADLVID